jgi:hypothetical protein
MKIAGTILLGTQAVAQCAAHTRKTWSVPLFLRINHSYKSDRVSREPGVVGGMVRGSGGV